MPLPQARPYDRLVAGTMTELENATSWAPTEIAKALEQGALAFKRRSGAEFQTAFESLDALASSVPGLTAEQQTAFAEGMKRRYSKATGL